MNEILVDDLYKGIIPLNIVGFLFWYNYNHQITFFFMNYRIEDVYSLN